jgi:hypothetical protein
MIFDCRLVIESPTFESESLTLARVRVQSKSASGESESRKNGTRVRLESEDYTILRLTNASEIKTNDQKSDSRAVLHGRATAHCAIAAEVDCVEHWNSAQNLQYGDCHHDTARGAKLAALVTSKFTTAVQHSLCEPIELRHFVSQPIVSKTIALVGR